MRILVAHNRYKFAGGEDSVMRAEVAMLRARGHEVELLEADNRHIESFTKKLSAARSVFSSPASHRKMTSLLRTFSPHIVHVHNWFPLLSPSIIAAAATAGVPAVQTLHNFRMLCAGGSLYRQGKVCHDCMGKAFPLAPTLHGCYSGSRLGSAVVSAAFAYHRYADTWDGVTKFIALTDFHRDLLIRGGVDASRTVVKPNFVPDPGVVARGTENFALFVGRLTPEKGIATVLDAWETGGMPMPLKILGDGPLADLVLARTTRLPNVEYLGHQPSSTVAETMRKATCLVFASTCYEPFALTIIEAFSSGLPVVAANLPSITNLVREGETGLCFNPGDPSDLIAKLNALTADLPRYLSMRARCRALYEERFTEAINYDLLMDIYRDCLQTQRSPAVAAASYPMLATANVLGIAVHALNMPTALEAIGASIDTGKKGYVCLAGAHGIIEAQHDAELKHILASATLVLPDGMPTVWMGRIQGHSEMARVFGPDLMLQVLGSAKLAHLRHVFCGGAPGVAEALRDAMQQRFPAAHITGVFTPPFRPMVEEEERGFQAFIAELQPHIIWVGLSTPKQERFMARYLPHLDTKLMIGVGAAFLFHTGAIADSPAWIKRLGLQWLHRLLQEPSRLWRRYLQIVPSFLLRSLLQLSGAKRYVIAPTQPKTPTSLGTGKDLQL